MKTLILLPFITFGLAANATNYYFSASGNDANNGTSISTPWQTLSKFNSVFSSRSPGDSLLFKRGDTFHGTLTISRSGTAGLPITIGAYGTGAKPIITGFATVSVWTNLGNNIWESTSAVSTLSTCNMVVINGINTPVGRLPNTGYYTYQSHTGTTSITSSSLSGTPNWTGAEVVIRSVQWILNRATISSQSSGTLTFPSIPHTPTDGFGFFIQNDVRTLDQQNEWYYNPSTKKLSIYSTNAPGAVLASSIDQLVTVGGAYINIDNISFTGANKNAIYNAITNTSNLTVQNCSIIFSGINGVDLANLSHFTITNCTISNSNNIAIRLEDSDPYATIRGNAIHNTGVIPGAGRSGFSGYSGISSVTPGTGLIAEYNSIVNTGYIAINFSGNSVLIKNNFIDSFCTVLQDGGGIYTQHANFTNRVIDGNIVLNGIGNIEGTNSTDRYAQGIYIDDGGGFVTVKNNTVAHMSASGIFLNGASNINILNNTVYDIKGLGFSGGSISFSRGGSFHIRNLLIKHNVFCQKNVQKDCWFFYSSDGNDADLLQFGVADSNYYARPIDDDDVFRIRSTNHGSPGATYTLAQWKTFSGRETNSNASPMTISDTLDLRFEYNATNSPVDVSLPYNYMDPRGIEHNGQITLQPYTSAVLIKNGAASGNQSPTANAGSDVSMTLPTNSTTLSGSGGDADGTIASYAWSRESGPTTFTLGTSNAATTTLNNLVPGTYVFRLTVTDNGGATATDNVTVTINAASQCSSTAALGAGSIINNNSIGVFNFSSPGLAATSDNSRSSASATISNLSGNTNYLKATGFNFAIPSTASICGIMVEVEKSASNISPLATVTDNSVRLVKGGIITGNNYATATNWSSTENYCNYGGVSDLWGTTWTPAEINATDFGLVFSAYIIGLVTLLPSVRIDHVRVTVYYNIVLPVQLTAFSARVQDAHSNLLQWTTHDNDEEVSFTIQRSGNGKDWKNIQTLKGEINAAYKTYEFNDACSDALAYYRILIMHRDGNLNYSAIARISRLAKNILSIYPNPANNYLQIDYPEKLYNIVCIGANGQTYAVRFQKNGGSNYTADIRHLPNGIYIIKLNGKSRMFVKH